MDFLSLFSFYLLSAPTVTAMQKILAEAGRLHKRYHRLLVVTAPPGSGKGQFMRELASDLGAPVVNLNQMLSEQLLEFAPHERPRKVQACLSAVMDDTCRATVVLAHTGILFDKALHVAPLRLLFSQSRYRTIIVSWSGTWDGCNLTYATPDHPEYYREEATELRVVSLHDNE